MNLFNLTIKTLLIPLNASYIFHQIVVYAHSSYFYFGGTSTSTIARQDGLSYKWSKVGQLKQGRIGHNAIYINGQFLVVGGQDVDLKTERCVYKNNQMVCHSQSPTLTLNHNHPELMIVSDDYCN